MQMLWSVNSLISALIIRLVFAIFFFPYDTSIQNMNDVVNNVCNKAIPQNGGQAI